jgi:glycosyltransferase involved in cell wall biosynthesis
LVLAECKGEFLERVDPRVKVVDLKALSLRMYTLRLAGYLKRNRPEVLLAQGSECGVSAVLARLIARVPTRIVTSCHGTLSRAVANTTDFKVRFLPWLMRLTFPFADGVVAVSEGVAGDLSATLGFPRESIRVIYNPSVTDSLLSFHSERPSHPFWQSGVPVLVAVGRMVLAKNFPGLIQAFQKALEKREMRLVVIGDGPERGRLERMVDELGIGEFVHFPGFLEPPWQWMIHSDLFVLSSSWEGLPTVLIEALALGCRIVSTDCPSGPREILSDGRFGQLAPVNDAQALADAMLVALDMPHDPLLQKLRARDFMVTPSAEAYRSLLLPDRQCD